MSKTTIPPKVITKLWTLSGGRCQYKGCNQPLWRDNLTMVQINTAYVAHIVADSPDGPRGDIFRSPLLAKDFNNLMLLCDTHHRLIDKEDITGHPESRLLEMKEEHEKRIELLSSLTPENKSHILFFGANIGAQSSPLSFKSCVQAILPEKFPADNYAIKLGMINSSILDDEKLYWDMETTNLVRQFKDTVEPLRLHNSIKDFALFTLAPQPLLIKLGTLFSDIYEVDVFQKHREPSTWSWQDKSDFNEFTLIPPDDFSGKLALNLSLSATITNDRIDAIFNGEKLSIWTITHDNPNNDFLKTRAILSQFRKLIRKFFDTAKAKHGQDAVLHVFPAMPISASVEFGRVWMPKADFKLIIYDQNKNRDGFHPTIEV